MDLHYTGWKSRAVIIHRDDNGYGLTVSGDNPVSVQTIKKGGAAELAGIQEGDIIIKVNGMPVDHLNHTEVVNLIKSAGAYVTLTVKPSDNYSGMPGVGMIGGNGTRPHGNLQNTHEGVSAPIPVEPAIQQQVDKDKYEILEQFRDKAAAEVNRLHSKYKGSKHHNDKLELEKAKQQLKAIENQMSRPNLQLHMPTPYNPYPQIHQPVWFQPNSSGHPPYPPLNPLHNSHRNRNPLGKHASVPVHWNTGEESPPPPLPPRSNSNFEFPPGYFPNDSHNSNNHSAHKYPKTNNILDKKGGKNSKDQLQQTHHRAKSSPDPISMEKALNAEASKRSDSVSDLSGKPAGWESVDSSRPSPPGSPPPAYEHQRPDNEEPVFIDQPSFFNNSFSPIKTLVGNLLPRPLGLDVMSMEEDDGANLGMTEHHSSKIGGNHGPYSSFQRLLEPRHKAHLAIFLNYVLNNNLDPSSLLFYLITNLDNIGEGGNMKEMKKWAYEIHSSFTAPGAPLLVPNVDEKLAAEIDDQLAIELEKNATKEMLIRVFRKARLEAKKEINKHLDEFNTKRIAGLGSMFGPPDTQLEECIADKTKENRILETYLLPRLEALFDDFERYQENRALAITSGVATVLQKHYSFRNTSNSPILDKIPLYVTSKNSPRAKFLKKPKPSFPSINFNEHHFRPHTYFSYTICSVCSKILWGINHQGYQCSDCSVNVHQKCINNIQENCLGLKKKTPYFWRPPSTNWPPSAKPNFGHGIGDLELGERPGSGGNSKSLRPDTVEEHLHNEEEEDAVLKPSNPVGRSESCKEGGSQKQKPKERRKHSDPNLPPSKSSDVDLERRLNDANNSGSSSNSSLSGRMVDSPSTSQELVVPSNHSSSSLPGRSSETPEIGAGGLSESFRATYAGWDGDSDIEIEQDPPDWTRNVPEETLASLHRLEKKRQEVLNELFHTERSHVKNLRIINNLFHHRIRQQKLLQESLIETIFANLEEMLDIHAQFNVALKKKRAESPLVGDIGSVLLEMFDGEKGETFKRAAATFCSRQQIGLEALKERRRKDQKFHAFLVEAEAESVCRRLQISDMIPMAMQRLTKYPLLFENLWTCTARDSPEYKNIQRAVEMSKEILNTVNQAKKEAEDNQRLFNIQSKLDKQSLDKIQEKSELVELRNLDFTKHRLIFEGPLLWRMTKNKQKSDSHEVHAVLLHDMVVLLLKAGERYILKPHHVSFKNDKNIERPIIKLNNLLCREVAADRKAFFLVLPTTINMYELVCSSPEERNIWLHHISKAAEDFKSRQQESRRSELLPNTNIPSQVPDSDERNKDEGDGEGEGGDLGESSSPSAEPQKDSSPAPESTPDSNSPDTPRSSSEGKKGPNPNRRQGEFLRVTETPPLVEPTEVLVEAFNVHFAQTVRSPYARVVSSSTSRPSIACQKRGSDGEDLGDGEAMQKELKRVDSSISRALEEKVKIGLKIANIPHEEVPSESSEISVLPLEQTPKDAKELILAGLTQVDQLERLQSSVKVTAESAGVERNRCTIQKNLALIFTQLMGEIQRNYDDLELRRAEVHRLREQNHSYLERLQAPKELNEKTGSSTTLIANISPSGSPTNSRPNSFLSLSSSSDHHEDDPECCSKRNPSKRIYSGPVDTSTCSCTSQHSPPNYTSGDAEDSACEFAQEEFADAMEDLCAPTEAKNLSIIILEGVKKSNGHGDSSLVLISEVEEGLKGLHFEPQLSLVEEGNTEEKIINVEEKKN